MGNIWEKMKQKNSSSSKTDFNSQLRMKHICAVMYRDLHGTRLNPETHGKINTIYILKNFPIVHAIGDRSIE